MALKLVLLSALVAVALADTAPYRPPPPPPPPTYSAPAPSYRAPAPSYNAPQPVSPPKYDFSWNVKDDYSGNDYGHQEGRDGYDTQGSYYVQLPDGRLQEVTYTVNGDSGFVAQVNYQGEAQYPTQQGYGSVPSYQAPAPSYQAPVPSYQAPAPSYQQPRPSYA
ncbi:cuticle protein 8-like [Scylla paramamosain]|uniref:cuticle protein 8-like n=1 Tax=Scylla paramamosain TaxID=85552 RepID=UPI0030835A9A